MNDELADAMIALIEAKRETARLAGVVDALYDEYQDVNEQYELSTIKEADAQAWVNQLINMEAGK